MSIVPALRRTATVTVLSLAFVVSVRDPAALAQQPETTADDILKAKCTICHSGGRVQRMFPEEIRPVLERMRKLNPDLITEADNEHVARAIAKILDDPNALAARNAWREAVDRGEALFNDTKLGATGKSCASCHSASSLRNVEDAYPKFDPVRKRFVDLNEAINYMIQERMKGTPLPPNDQRYFDLLAYIKTLK